MQTTVCAAVGTVDVPAVFALGFQGEQETAKDGWGGAAVWCKQRTAENKRGPP